MRDEYSSWYLMNLIHGLKFLFWETKIDLTFKMTCFIILIKSAGMVGLAEINGKQKWGAGVLAHVRQHVLAPFRGGIPTVIYS